MDYYYIFGDSRETFISQNLAHAKFCENKNLPNSEIFVSFTDDGKSCPSYEFSTWQICLLTLLAKIKFSQKITEFTVHPVFAGKKTNFITTC